jgi:hypothetical protein
MTAEAQHRTLMHPNPHAQLRAGTTVVFILERGLSGCVPGASLQALEYASESLRNNMDVVLAAVRKRAASLQFASSRLQNDLKVVLTAIAPSLQIKRRGRLHHNVSSAGVPCGVAAASDTDCSAVTPCAEAVPSSAVPPRAETVPSSAVPPRAEAVPSNAVPPRAETVRSSGSSVPDHGEASGRLGGNAANISDISGDGSAPNDTNGAQASSPADVLSSRSLSGDEASWHLGYWHVSQPQPDTLTTSEVPLTKLELKSVSEEWEPENRGLALSQVVIFKPNSTI